MRGALPTTFYGVLLRDGYVPAALQAVTRKWFGFNNNERSDARHVLGKKSKHTHYIDLGSDGKNSAPT